jgi:DNA-binding PadR family transcriptional regulator
MSAKHVVLGLLLEGPAYQYQLRDRMKHRLGPAWEVDTGQLSRIMRELARDELIVPVESATPRKPRRHVYRIAEQGVEELERWLDEGVEGVRLPRRPLLVKLALGGQRRLEDDALAKIDAYEADCMREGAQLTRLLREIPPDGLLVRADHLLLRLNLSADVAHLQGELTWARQARQIAGWFRTHEAVWPPTRRGRNE